MQVTMLSVNQRDKAKESEEPEIPYKDEMSGLRINTNENSHPAIWNH